MGLGGGSITSHLANGINFHYIQGNLRPLRELSFILLEGSNTKPEER